MPRPKPFQYQTLLRVRKRQEDLCAQALAAVRRERDAAEKTRKDIERDQARMLAEASEATERGGEAGAIRRFYQYERHLADLATRTDARILELRAETDKRRAALEDAMKRRRTIERLEERHDRAVQNVILKNEQALADEAAISQVARSIGLRAADAALVRQTGER